nr:MAG TPA: hypothetical protein [Caudoviricetes sp.]DAU62215.1 MAG TPA: hypothetical protein [Caudoviricetes sp.]
MLSRRSTRFTKLFHRFFDINIKYHPFYFYHIRKTYGYITKIKKRPALPTPDVLRM